MDKAYSHEKYDVVTNPPLEKDTRVKLLRQPRVAAFPRQALFSMGDDY
jgi:hypothetical protein